MFPDMVISASETRGMLVSQRVETLTHLEELLSFAQDGTGGIRSMAFLSI
jgi:hypothetical protein